MIVRLATSRASVPAKGNVDVGIEIVGASDVGAVELVVVYPEGLLAFENATVGPFLAEGGAPAYLGSDSRYTGHGQVGLVLERHEAEEGASGSGRLTGVRFRAVGSGVARIGLEQGVARRFGSAVEIPCDWEGTQVLVKERLRRAGNLEPSPRDIQILCWAHEMKHLTYEQVMAFFHRPSVVDATPWYGQKRLEKLVATKALRRMIVFGQERKALVLGNRGLDLLKVRGLDRDLALYRAEHGTPSPAGGTFGHDATLVELRRILEIDLGLVVEWLSERVVRHKERAQGGPDAIVALRHMESGAVAKVAIELELSRKLKARYAKLLERYAMRRDLDAVLYLAGSPAIAAVVQKTRPWRLSASRGPRIHVALLGDVMAHGVAAVTRTAAPETDGWRLGDLAQGGRLALAS
ncbi:MAG: cohesin domain-containing protein [Acidobacteriota bacterium]